jgi:hypothetical protein
MRFRTVLELKDVLGESPPHKMNCPGKDSVPPHFHPVARSARRGEGGLESLGLLTHPFGHCRLRGIACGVG